GRVERLERLADRLEMARARDPLHPVRMRRQRHDELELVASLQLPPQLLSRDQVHLFTLPSGLPRPQLARSFVLSVTTSYDRSCYLVKSNERTSHSPAPKAPQRR